MKEGYRVGFFESMPEFVQVLPLEIRWEMRLRMQKRQKGKDPNCLILLWWAMRDSNARPLVPETNALSN